MRDGNLLLSVLHILLVIDTKSCKVSISSHESLLITELPFVLTSYHQQEDEKELEGGSL